MSKKIPEKRIKKGSAGCLRGKEAKGVDCVNPAQPA